MSKENNKVGRPPMYETPEEMQEKIDQYFIDGMKKRKVLTGKPPNQISVEIECPTITGLVLYLGFCDRSAFYAYENKPEFKHTIKKARTLIENVYEELMQLGSTTAIFALKNMGWKDKQDIEHSGNIGNIVVDNQRTASILEDQKKKGQK